MQPLVRLEGVSVHYNATKALEGVTLDIYEDDFIGIIGPNGGGKTTLVKSILGLTPHSGDITYAPALLERGYRHIGYLPQQAEFDREFPITILDVVLSGLQAEKGVLGRYSSAERAKALSLLEMAGIAEVAQRQVSEVSGGQMQRALLCRAIITEPRLLILDEPASFVDNLFEQELYALLRKLNERMAIVMVSHDIGAITGVVKSIVCVNRTVHRHNSNFITPEQLENYHCPFKE